MLIAERQSEIIKMIQINGSVQVDELARALKVSCMTIRRDLEKLQEEGIIERCHGGAVVKQEVTYADKKISHRQEKQRLALLSADYVKKDTTVYLDAGTTTYEIAKLISHMPGILVATNDLEIAQLLKEGEAELFMCGGYVQKTTGSVYGYYATQMMGDFGFDIGFFGAASIDHNFQVRTPTADKAFLKRQIAEQCRQSFLVVDESKFYREAMIKVNDLGDYTGVLTNRRFSEKEEAVFAKKRIKIISV